MLWDHGPTSFLPHGVAGGPSDVSQPILLSTSPDAPNLARNMLIADGIWREAALSYDRTFYLFDNATLEGARLAWKLLAGREGIDRRYWAQESGKWVKKG
jgi:DNA polymerase-3 subunit chi